MKMKLIKNLSIIAILSIGSYAADLDVKTQMDKNNNMENELQVSKSNSSKYSNTKNSISNMEKEVVDEAIVQNDNSNKIRKSNDVLTKTQNTELLNDPEVIRLINEAYKNGFTAGAEESEFVMKKKLDKMSKHMDSLFAFHKLYLEGKLEPPKIGIINEPVQVTKNGKVMVIQQEYMEIIEPAKFIDQPKTWKNFLID